MKYPGVSVAYHLGMSTSKTPERFVYVDRTADTGDVFYVGQGNRRRAGGLSRNRKHTAVRKKHGLVRDVVLETLEADLALELERVLIAHHHTFVDDPEAGPLACNFTTGGEVGTEITDEMKQKFSRVHKGKVLSPETREKIAAALRGRKATPEALEKMRKPRRPWKHSEDGLRRIAESTCRPKSKEHMQKIWEARRRSGKTVSPETLEAMRLGRERAKRERQAAQAKDSHA